MIRRLMFGVCALLALLIFSGPARARVNVQIGINLGTPPQLLPVPGTAVMYAPAVPGNYFFYGGQYYVFVNGAWYLSGGYNGPWVVVAPEYVPPPILGVPLGYYRVRPRAWRGWAHEAPPHWPPGWGRHGGEHREGPRGASRGPRHEERHEEHREDRR